MAGNYKAVPVVFGQLDCDLNCGNYDGMKYDAEEAVRMLLKLADGQTTAERAREWARLNWPKVTLPEQR